MNLQKRLDKTKLAAPLFFAGVLALFFVSGASGLLYQVVWTRKLALLFGTASYAVSTVLSVFFVGLAFGSLWGGRLADRVRRPLFLYGVFELVIGLWAVLFILFIGSAESVVAGALRAFAAGRPGAILARTALSFAFLLVPVLLMGATLPLLAKFVTAESRARSLRIGALYSVNTFGAVTGCFVTGFIFLAAFGYTRTTLIGAAGNALVGIAAIIAGHRPAIAPASPGTPSTPAQAPPVEPSARSRFAAGAVLACFGVSGFCALALEVLWTRLLTIVFLGTTYAFTTMLTAILCGIAVGSAVASPLVDKARRPVSLFGIVEVLIGVACLLMLPVFAALPDKLEAMRIAAGSDWARLVQAKFLLAFAVLFAPTFLFGTTFPIVVKALLGARVGRDVGRLYFANTFGGVLGALAGGYLIIPHLGTHHGIILLGTMLCLSGITLISACPVRKRFSKAALVSATALGLFLIGQVLPEDVGRAVNQWFVPENHRVVHYAEGVEGTVVVAEEAEGRPGSDRVLYINAVQATASIEKGVKMNRLQGVLPLLFDREPRSALFMCFGSGITAGTLALWDFDRIDAVEISGEVLDAAPLFAKDNLDVLDNPRVNFIVDDGRNFLLTTRNSYDVITFEPMPLALAGVSTFYTKEYYDLCLNRLAPGALVSQWVPLHSLEPGLVRSLVRTFAEAFPEHCMWFVNADLFLIGSNEPLVIDYEGVRRRISHPLILKALSEVGLADIPELLNCFFMSGPNMDRYLGEGPVMSDDRPWAEFVAPKLMYESHVPEALSELQPWYQSPVVLLSLEDTPSGEQQRIINALERRHASHAQCLEGLKKYYGGGPGSRPEDEFKKALAIDPHDKTAQYYLGEIALARAKLHVRWDEPEKALAALQDALDYIPDRPDLHLLLGDILFEAGDVEQACRRYAVYLSLGGTAERARTRCRETLSR